METEKTWTLKDVRARLKLRGYRLKTTKNSEFTSCDVLGPDGKKVNLSVAKKEHFEEHADVYAFLKSIRGNVFEDSDRHRRLIF